MELKIEHEGIHVTFLDLNISIGVDIFVYKLNDKCDNFIFSIVRMPQLAATFYQLCSIILNF